MKVINGYRVEKDTILNKWVAFEKIGVNGWLEKYRAKTYKEVKLWDQKKKSKKIEKGKQNVKSSKRS